VINRKATKLRSCLSLLLLVGGTTYAANWSSVQVGAVCVAQLINTGVGSDRERCLSEVRRELREMPVACKLARVSVVASQDGYWDLLAGPSFLNGGVKEFWNYYEGRQLQKPVPSCQVMRFGASESVSWADRSGAVWSGGGPRFEFLRKPAASLRLIHFNLSGTPQNRHITLFFSGVEVTPTALREVMEPLAGALAWKEHTLSVRVARRPWFFDDDEFPSRNPWIVPGGVSLNDALTNRATSCVWLRGKVRCMRP
jgi:hypothetical protein